MVLSPVDWFLWLYRLLARIPQCYGKLDRSFDLYSHVDYGLCSEVEVTFGIPWKLPIMTSITGR